MTEVWALPGYDVQALIGYGATGEVWRARELATGEAVALKRLRADADPTAVEALRREATLLRSLDTPYVVRLRAMLGEGAETVLVLDLAGAGSLAGLLSRRGTLDPGEVVTIAAPLAQALAAAHACGLVHGDVSPANVLFTRDGMPLLSDLGLARLAGEARSTVDGTAEYVDPAVAVGGQPTAASDVWALAAVCHHLLAGAAPHDGQTAGDVLAAARAGARAPLGLLAPSAPRALVLTIEQALHPDPDARPDAAAFAAAVRRAHAAAPVRFDDRAAVPGPETRPTHTVHAVPAPAPPPAPKRVERRTLALAAAGAAVLVAAAGIGWLSGRSAPTELASVTAPAAVSAAAQPDWHVVLDRLDAQRAAAFAAADPKLLAAVYAPSSPLLVADTAAVSRLRASGSAARGVRHHIRSVAVRSASSDRAVLDVVDVLPSYDVVDAAGQVIQRAAARGAAHFEVALVRTAGGWRLDRVTPT